MDKFVSDLTPRERRQQRTHNAILSTAIELVREKGIDKLSLREIARRIDYSPAGLYEYFGSKEEIIEAICEEGNLRLSRHLGRIDQNLPFEDYILELGQAYVQFAVEDPDYFELMFARSFTDQQTFTAEELEGFEPDSTDSLSYAFYAIKDAIKDGIIETRGKSTIDIALGIWAMAHGMAVLRITSLANYEIDFKSLQENTIQTYLRGLMAKS